MTIKRYLPVIQCDCPTDDRPVLMVEAQEGVWVRDEDHDQRVNDLIGENNDLRRDCQRFDERCAALEVRLENAALQPRCQALTKAGNPCKMLPMTDSDLCGQHHWKRERSKG